MNRAMLAFGRLELAESLRSKWLAFTSALYAVLFLAFVWFGLRESSVLGFSGLSRVVLSVSHALVLAIPLLVLFASSTVIVRARTSGLFELLLVQPCRRFDWFVGVLAARMVVLIGPLLLLFLVSGLASLVMGGEAGLFAIATRCLVISVGLIWAFSGIGFYISATAKTAERATVLALVAWAGASALHDFALMGILLKTSLPPSLVFALAAVNPSEAARVGILAGVDPEVSILGPVGFWIANSLGARLTYAFAVGWPLSLGSIALWRAADRLQKADLVG
ncbi:MAG: ABC transporter permease [Myxococcales bacterium]